MTCPSTSILPIIFVLSVDFLWTFCGDRVENFHSISMFSPYNILSKSEDKISENG